MIAPLSLDTVFHVNDGLTKRPFPVVLDHISTAAETNKTRKGISSAVEGACVLDSQSLVVIIETKLKYPLIFVV
jgi:hypothetical protein